ncbi:MAG TPA: hypothetical protein VK147_12415 [Candidatus Didemnitutus sp.]|nr:hypothetical protein [Candidatus Didemnitutus sp.]
MVLHSPLDRTGITGADVIGVLNTLLFTVTIEVYNEQAKTGSHDPHHP